MLLVINYVVVVMMEIIFDLDKTWNLAVSMVAHGKQRISDELHLVRFDNIP